MPISISTIVWGLILSSQWPIEYQRSTSPEAANWIRPRRPALQLISPSRTAWTMKTGPGKNW